MVLNEVTGVKNFVALLAALLLFAFRPEPKSMESFVKNLRPSLERLRDEAAQDEVVVVVMGNESCDLDSAVSAIVSC